MPTQIKIRRDTAANWTSINPTLSLGEPGLETDTLKIKYGNGTSAWRDLSYAGVYTLPKASETVLGGVKIDGTTIAVDENGVISSLNANAGAGTVNNGLAGRLAYYLTSGITLDDTVGMYWNSGSQSLVVEGSITAATYLGLPVASNTIAGIVRVDGTSITSNNGVISGGVFVGGTVPNATTFESSVTFNSLTTSKQTQEVITPITGATGTVVHNSNLGYVFYHTSVASNFSPNVTNLDITNNRTNRIKIIINQGSTPYSISTFQITGSQQVIKWEGGPAPTPSANKVEVYTFDCNRVGSNWLVTASFASYG